MTSIDIIQEVQQNFIDSSYDVNTNRAFPDVRDGLKPSQRCCLWEMYERKYTSNKPHVKSAKISGSVAALWHPHGTQAIYETFTRMSQPFINNVPEVDFHGANGNIVLGGDAIAADRYTEARLSKITEDYMLNGIDKNTVPMVLNFSEDEYMPTVLPSLFPRLLVNGAQGIGVSVANTWLPHNLMDTINVIGKYIKRGELDYSEYYPDFPTGGTVINKDELSIINETGKGRVILQAKYCIEGKNIIFYEMPYQVYIEPVIEKIKEQVEKGELTGIKDVINKCDKKNIALVIECQRNYNPEEVVEQLFQQTSLRSQYNANQNGIISKTPVLLNLQQTIDVYVTHNLQCIKNEHKFDLDNANKRIEILEGLSKAIAHIDEIVSIIRKSENIKVAKETLSSSFGFTENQAKAILEMRLSKLTKLDGVAVDSELEEKKKVAEFCGQVVESEELQKDILLKRLKEMGKKYKTERRTQVIQEEVKKEKKIAGKPVVASEPVVITFNSIGYLQRVPVTQYRNSDFPHFKATTTDNILLFTSTGRFIRIAVSSVKECGPKDKGTAIGSIIKLEPQEKVIQVLSNEFNEKRPYVFFAMENGIVKKSEKTVFMGDTRNMKGQVAIKTDSTVVGIFESNGDDCLLKTNAGFRIRFDAEEVRTSGKTSAGVKGISLSENDFVIECKIVSKDTITKTPRQKRGGKGKRVE